MGQFPGESAGELVAGKTIIRPTITSTEQKTILGGTPAGEEVSKHLFRSAAKADPREESKERECLQCQQACDDPSSNYCRGCQCPECGQRPAHAPSLFCKECDQKPKELWNLDAVNMTLCFVKLDGELVVARSNKDGVHAEVRALTAFERLVSPKKGQRVSIAITRSPCYDCAKRIRDFSRENSFCHVSVKVAKKYAGNKNQVSPEGQALNVLGIFSLRTAGIPVKFWNLEDLLASKHSNTSNKGKEFRMLESVHSVGKWAAKDEWQQFRGNRSIKVSELGDALDEPLAASQNAWVTYKKLRRESKTKEALRSAAKLLEDKIQELIKAKDQLISKDRYLRRLSKEDANHVRATILGDLEGHLKLQRGVLDRLGK